MPIYEDGKEIDVNNIELSEYSDKVYKYITNQFRTLCFTPEHFSGPDDNGNYTVNISVPLNIDPSLIKFFGGDDQDSGELCDSALDQLFEKIQAKANYDDFALLQESYLESTIPGYISGDKIVTELTVLLDAYIDNKYSLIAEIVLSDPTIYDGM